MIVTGQCTCGQLRVRASGDPLRVGICHCRDCQRHHGAAFYAAAVYPGDAVKIDGRANDHKGRAVCPARGASVFAVSGAETELHLGALDPGHGLTPSYECWTIRRLPWIAPFEGMIQYERDRRPDAPSKA